MKGTSSRFCKPRGLPCEFGSFRHCQMLLLMIIISSNRVSASSCYYFANNTIYPSPGGIVPCGSATSPPTVTSCCNADAGDVCLSDSICYRPKISGPTYHLSSCTDSTYNAPECPQYCSTSATYNVSYSRHSNANQ